MNLNAYLCIQGLLCMLLLVILRMILYSISIHGLSCLESVIVRFLSVNEAIFTQLEKCFIYVIAMIISTIVM